MNDILSLIDKVLILSTSLMIYTIIFSRMKIFKSIYTRNKLFHEYAEFWKYTFL